MTPLRPDPRPISGLMHQVWVLTHLTRLYRALLASPSEAVARNLRPVQKRLALHEDGLEQGVAALAAAGDGLTPDGMLLLEALCAAAEAR
jgi:HEXXH motif-containing protein